MNVAEPANGLIQWPDMKTDSLKRYTSLRQTLLAEKAVITIRLNAINEALGGNGAVRARKGGMSAAGRARIAAAQRARWAKVKAAKKAAK